MGREGGGDAGERPLEVYGFYEGSLGAQTEGNIILINQESFPTGEGAKIMSTLVHSAEVVLDAAFSPESGMYQGLVLALQERELQVAKDLGDGVPGEFKPVRRRYLNALQMRALVSALKTKIRTWPLERKTAAIPRNTVLEIIVNASHVHREDIMRKLGWWRKGKDPEGTTFSVDV